MMWSREGSSREDCWRGHRWIHLMKKSERMVMLMVQTCASDARRWVYSIVNRRKSTAGASSAEKPIWQHVA